MTEFVIAATYVLVPLFILIPLLGKYIDIKHATIMAARYEAWEYTVWYTLDSEDTGDTNATLLPDDNDILDNFAAFDMSLNYKTLANTRAEAHNRTLSSVGAEFGDGTSADDTAKTVRISPISSTSDTSVDTVAGCSESSNLLWTDHAGLPLYCGEVVRNDYGVGDPTPTLTLFGMDVGDWINQILGLFAAAFGFIADIVGFVSTGDGPSAGFTAINLDGYSFVDLQTLVATHSYGADLRTDLSGRPSTAWPWTRSVTPPTRYIRSSRPFRASNRPSTGSPMSSAGIPRRYSPILRPTCCRTRYSHSNHQLLNHGRRTGVRLLWRTSRKRREPSAYR